MAKLLNEKHIFNTHSRDRLERKVDYALLFGEKPLFVTYYAQNMTKTTFDKTLETVQSPLGDNSPIKFNRIDDFPLFSFPRLDPNLDISDMGPTNNIEGTTISIPGIIEPVEGDYFILSSLPERYVFKVNSVNIDDISYHKYFSLDFSLVFSSEDELKDKTVDDYIVDYDKNMMYNNKDYKIRNDFYNIFIALRNIFKEYFYDEYLNVIYNDDGYGRIIIDPLLHKLFIRNNILISTDKKEYLDNIYLDDIKFDKTTNFENMRSYETSFYNSLESRDFDEGFKRLIFGALPNTYEYNKLALIEGTIYYVSNYNFNSYKVFDDDFYDRIRYREYYNSTDNIIDDIIIKYFNIKERDAFVDGLIDQISNIDKELSLSFMYKFAILLFIIKKLIDNYDSLG